LHIVLNRNDLAITSIISQGLAIVGHHISRDDNTALLHKVLLLERSKLAKSTWYQEGGDLQMCQFPARGDQQDKLISKLKQSRFLLVYLGQKGNYAAQEGTCQIPTLIWYQTRELSLDRGMTISLADVDQKGPWGTAIQTSGLVHCGIHQRQDATGSSFFCFSYEIH
jgi:hypothetical protein